MRIKTRCQVRAKNYREWQRQIRSETWFFDLMEKAHKNIEPKKFGPKGQPCYAWSETRAEMRRLYNIQIGKRPR